MRLLPLVLLLVVSSCGSSKKSSNPEANKEKKELIIALERTACYGTCPIYKIEVFSDGSAMYYGERFVDNLGKYTFNVSQETINYILKKAVEIRFFEMEDKYTADITDLPKTIVFIKKDRKKKKIIDYYGAPKTLKEFESLVDGCVDYRRMKSTKD